MRSRIPKALQQQGAHGRKEGSGLGLVPKPPSAMGVHEQEAPERQDAALSSSAGFDFSRIPLFPPAGLTHVQPRLEVSGSEDEHEREAERIADEVIHIEASAPGGGVAGEDEAGGAKPWPEAALSRKIQREGDGFQGGEMAGAAVEARLSSRLGQGHPLPNGTRGEMESVFGTSLARVRIHSDSQATELSRTLRAQAFTYGNDVFFNAGRYDPHSTVGRHLLAHELAHVLQQGGTSGRSIQRKKTQESVKVTYTLTLHEQISGHEFFVRVVMRHKGTGREDAEKLISDGRFSCSHPVCATGVTASLVGQPIQVAVTLGGLSAEAKAGMRQRASGLSTLPPNEKDAVHSEADRRFWSRTGYKPGSPLGKGAEEEGMRQLWLRTRDEVLQDKERVDTLPPKIREFLKPGGQGQIRPEDYATVLRIAKKLEGFSEADWILYKRRVSATTHDYERLERSIASFLAGQSAEKRVMDRLKGTETLFQQVKGFEALQREMFTPPLKSDRLPIDLPGNQERYASEQASLSATLTAAGFASIKEFKDAQAAFLELFRQRAVELTLLVLQESERTVLSELERYANAEENARLFALLAPVRSAVDESQREARKSMPTPMQLKLDSPELSSSQQQALARSVEASQRAEVERQKHTASHPILKDPKLRSEALNTSDAGKLGAVLRENAQERLWDIRKTRANVREKPDLIFKLDRIVELTRQELGVSAGSIYESILQDHKSRVEAKELIVSIAMAALGIGLGLLTFGGGTVAVVAGAAGLGLSAYGAAEEWEKYSTMQSAAHTSFDKALSVSSEEPTALWVALSLLAVGLDGAGLVSAFKAAAPAAKVFEATGDVAKFEAELARATALSEALKKSLVKSARAESEYRGAAEELARALRESLSRAYMAGLDAELLAKTTKAAYYAAKKGIRQFEVFLRELKLQKFAKGIDFDNLSAEQLKALEDAFQKGLANEAADAAKTAFSVQVPYKGGAKTLTFNESGQMLLEGSPVPASRYEEVYKQLRLTHVRRGHGPDKNPLIVANEARSNSPSYAAGKFASDRTLLESVEAARAELHAGRATPGPGGFQLVDLPATPGMGRAFMRKDVVPAGITPVNIQPFESLDDVVELAVVRIRAVFGADGSIISVYPIGF